MAGKPQFHNQPQAPALDEQGGFNITSPPALHASRFGFNHTATDIGLSFATARVVIDPVSGLPRASGLEWLITVMMSPTLAQQLHEVLGVVLTDYETRFGTIPKDPNFSISSIRDKYS
jgi:hypothetical protein